MLDDLSKLLGVAGKLGFLGAVSFVIATIILALVLMLVSFVVSGFGVDVSNTPETVISFIQGGMTVSVMYEMYKIEE